jgi:hypothetical protein
MNIFYLHKNPYKAAQYQYNKHVVKMILESAQMLCTAHHCYGSAKQQANVPYKQAHLNHPSTVWARQSRETYMWLYYHMIGLGDEYTKRYNKQHLTITKCGEFLSTPPKYIKGNEWVQPPQAMPDEYKDNCSVKAYWNYYIGDKSHIAGKKEITYENMSQVL